MEPPAGDNQRSAAGDNILTTTTTTVGGSDNTTSTTIIEERRNSPASAAESNTRDGGGGGSEDSEPRGDSGRPEEPPPLDDSGDCPLLVEPPSLASPPPAPERSPPPLLPNDEDEDENTTKQRTLAIKDVDFLQLAEEPFSNLASVEATIPSLVKIPCSTDGGGSDGVVIIDSGGGCIGPTSTSSSDQSSWLTKIDVSKASVPVIPDCRNNPDTTPPQKASADSSNNSKSEAVCSTTSEQTAALEKSSKRSSMYAAITPPTSCLLFSAPPPAPGSAGGGSNLYAAPPPARIRNASANSCTTTSGTANSCAGHVRLRHGGFYRPGAGGYNNYPSAIVGGGGGGSERDLPRTQHHLQRASPPAYDYNNASVIVGGAAATVKDKTQRWSLAGTAPEVALLRLKLENVERELTELRGKHETTMNDYQVILQQLELCRAAKCRQDADMANLTAELVRWKAECDAACQNRAAVEREVTEYRFKLQSKQLEVDELRQQARELSRQPGELASKLMEEYEELRIDREKLREQCRFLDNANAELQAALHSHQSEACQMQSRYERELDDMRVKKNSLESRQMTSYQQLHRIVQERDLLSSEREMLQQQLDDACADRTRLLNWRQKMESDYQQLRQQHESAVTEYHRVMSERDSILKENERHCEEKAHLGKKLKALENDYHSAVDQVKSLEFQLIHLQQHHQQQQQQDDLMSFKSSSSISIHHTPVMTTGGGGRRQLPAIPPQSSNNASNPAFDPALHNPFLEQRSIASSESEVALITSRAQEEEFEKARRQMDSMKEQMELARQQLEAAKSRRDWAFSERQRVVAERDSLRTLCDTLRQERDDAITRLATAIRDTDELQRQKQFAEGECRKLKEKIALEMKQKRAQGGGVSDLDNPRCSPSNSRDSAIDTDMAEWEIETIELNVDSNQKSADLGVELGGGRDDPIFDGNTVPIYVKRLSKGCKFVSVLRPYDCIVQVNNIDVTFMERRSVLDILRNSTAVKMVIHRRRLIGMKLISVPLNASNDGDMGITFEDCVYVNRIKTGSPAAKAGNLAVGDRLVYVNDIPVHGKTASEVQQLLSHYKGCLVVLAVMKSPPVMSPTTSWPGGFVNGSGAAGASSRTSGPVVSGGGGGTTSTRQSYSQQQHHHPGVVNRDESVQTLASSSEQLLDDQNLSSSGSCLALPRKQDSLLDKVHDKFFRRTDKKPIVKALANIANDVTSVSGLVKHSVGGYDRLRYKGDNSNSVCCSSSSSPAGGNGRGGGGGGTNGCGTSQEQQALQQLDRILEDAETPINKVVSNVVNSEKSSSGTWPKSRGVDPSSPATVAGINSGVLTISQQQSKRGSANRKTVFNVFQQPPPNSDAVSTESTTVAMEEGPGSQEYASMLSNSHYAATVRSRPPLTNNNGNSNNNDNNNTYRRTKRDNTTTRPLSYHPPTASVYSTTNTTSGNPTSAAAARQNTVVVDPETGGGYCQQQIRKTPTTSPLAMPPYGSAAAAAAAAQHHNHANSGGAGGGSRPPSAQGNRRRPVSYYHQQSTNHHHHSDRDRDHNEDVLLIPRATQATVVTQHYPTHLALVTPVRQTPPTANSPWHNHQQQQHNHQQQHNQQHSSSTTSTNNNNWTGTPRSPTSVLGSAGPSFEMQPDERSSVASLNSPTPSLYNHHIQQQHHRPPSYCRKAHDLVGSPSLTDVRTVRIEKQYASEGLGIRIISHGNGVFISAVEKESLAARHGLQVGDQLLDVCGINMRGANMQAATNVLSQLVRFEHITLTVQYDQNRYLTAAADYHHHQSATSTPRATPNSLMGGYMMKPTLSARGCGSITQQSRETVSGDDTYGQVWSEPRFVFVKRDVSVWPFTMIGGNATGIFIDTVKENAPTTSSAGSLGSLRCGDQILEFDGVDFRKITMEQALFEMQHRPIGAEVSMLVQYNEAKYQRSKRGAGDLFYVRVTVDRQAENRDELNFKAGDILRVDNTVFNGVTGLWRAWAVDQEGREISCGIIPSKLRLEDELFRRSGSEISGGGDGGSEGGGSRRGTIRRSLKFIRRSSRSTHQRAPSKDSRDLADAADTALADELYQRVERLDYKQKRPVLIVGALVDTLVAKLMQDYPKMFAHCAPECVQPTSISILNQGIKQNIYIDYQKRDKLFEITSVAALKTLMDKGFHCILRVSVNAIERLHRLQIYPVVLYIKFKDYKQIKELSEGQVSSKEAKEMFQQAVAMEAEFHNTFNAVIQTQHGNIKHICQRIADAVEHEQKKTLWLISSENI